MIPSRPSLDRRRFTLSLSGAALGLTSSLVFAATRGDIYKASMPLMGTRVEISLGGDLGPDMAHAAEKAFAEMGRLSNMMSRFQTTSELNRINLMAGLAPVLVSPELMQVLRMAQHAHRLSEGAFDATVGTYSGWRFDADHGALPDPATLATQRAWVGQSAGLLLNEAAGTAFLLRRGTRLDLGGVAKLPILQAGMAQLHSHGIQQAMINGGGDVLALARSQDRPWRVGLRDPRRPAQLLGTVAVRTGWVAASGDYERFFIHNGKRLHHVLNPRTGYPSQGAHGVVLMGHELASINGMGAAVMVAGTSAGQSIVQHAPGVDALIVGNDNQLWLSRGMERRLTLA